MYSVILYCVIVCNIILILYFKSENKKIKIKIKIRKEIK